MKNYIFILFLSLFLTGCPDSDLKERTYILENNSNHSLKLKFYNDDGVLLGYKTIILENNGEQFNDRLDYTNEIDLFNFPSLAFDVDSIVIDFDNLKRRTYAIDFLNESFSEPLNRNIFKHENYENIGNDNFLFLITEEDYNTAEDIN